MPGKPLPIAVNLDTTDPATGLVGKVALAPGGIGKVTAKSTVFAGKAMRPVATLGDLITPHGNFTNPKMPGFNPTCASSVISNKTISNVLVNGKPVAVSGPIAVGSVTTCTHVVVGPGIPTVLVGGTQT